MTGTIARREICCTLTLIVGGLLTAPSSAELPSKTVDADVTPMATAGKLPAVAKEGTEDGALLKAGADAFAASEGLLAVHDAAPHGLSFTRPPEEPNDPPAPLPQLQRRTLQPARRWTRGVFTSVQVNVDAFNNNMVGDAANEPSMAISRTAPDQIVIGWRQFDTIASNFRQAGVAYSHDGGQSWTMDTLDPGQFRSDPVLGTDAAGNFFYSSLSSATSAEMFKSIDGGVNWLAPVGAFGGDKQWIAVDATAGIGSGHVYQIWNVQFSCCPPNDFTRSVDGAASFQLPVAVPPPSMKWGTLDVGPDGTLYAAGATLNASLGHLFTRSTDARDSGVTPTFADVLGVDLGGSTASGGINGSGLLGQVWVATDHSTGPTAGYIYVLGTVSRPADPNRTDVKFIRSVDGGATWSAPVRVNDDPASGAWHWFGTMSVAPNGRIDAIWNDTRNDPGNLLTEVFYAFSLDGGVTWSANEAVTLPFDPTLGYPSQNKIGDYYHMISDAGGANLAYAATFNGEEDVYFLRIPQDCNNNGIEDDCDVACGPAGGRCDVAGCGTFADCNANAIPDICEPDEDCNVNTVSDICDIGAGTSSDCNANRIPDECESTADCNGNTVLDICDLGTGFSTDCNDNGIPDECDIASQFSDDDNSDGMPDECQGACCSCDGCVNTTAIDCAVREGIFSGLSVTCGEPGACTPPVNLANDDCAAAETLPSQTDVTVPFDNLCASLDGPAYVPCGSPPSATPFGTDLWYHYEAPCTGTLTVSQCDNTDYDAMLAVYGGAATCACPSDNGALLACGDDTCGVGGGPAVVTLPASSGNCYTIRAGGWSGSTGTGELNLTMECDLGDPLPAPYPHDRLKNRYISFDPNKVGNNTVAVAFKIEIKSIQQGSCSGSDSAPCRHEQGEGLNEPGDDDCRRCSGDTRPCISSSVDCTPASQTCDLSGETCSNDDPASAGTNVGLIRWVGPENNGRFLAVTLAFRAERVGASWPDVIHVGDCEIVPQAVYGIRAVSVASSEESGELLVSTQIRPANGVFAWWTDGIGNLSGFCNNGDLRAATCLPNDGGACDNNPAECKLAWTEPNQFSGFDDIVATIQLFSATGGAPTAPMPPGVPVDPSVPDVTWVDMHGSATGAAASDPPDGRAGFADIQAEVLAFQGRPYPYFDPVDCPDVGAWP